MIRWRKPITLCGKKRLALCLESRVDGKLAGGLYGVCFFGESMYSEMENGSKLALIMLAELLDHQSGPIGFLMIDCQFYTKHLESMGGREISWKEYRKLLDEGIGQNLQLPEE